jgi:nitrogen fixation/metabolism regulation signal transduction histidine kinase
VTFHLQTKIAVLQERNAQFHRTVDSLKQDCAAKEAALIDAAAEFDKRLIKHEAASERLLEAETMRADATEREAEDGRRQVKEERRVNGELKKRIGVMEAARKQSEEEARRMVVDAEGVKDEQLIVLKEMVVELQRMNNELVEKAKKLRERYESNALVGSAFVLLGLFCDGTLIRGICVDGRRKRFRCLATKAFSVAS